MHQQSKVSYVSTHPSSISSKSPSPSPSSCLSVSVSRYEFMRTKLYLVVYQAWRQTDCRASTKRSIVLPSPLPPPPATPSKSPSPSPPPTTHRVFRHLSFVITFLSNKCISSYIRQPERDRQIVHQQSKVSYTLTSPFPLPSPPPIPFKSPSPPPRPPPPSAFVIRYYFMNTNCIASYTRQPERDRRVVVRQQSKLSYVSTRLLSLISSPAPLPPPPPSPSLPCVFRYLSFVMSL